MYCVVMSFVDDLQLYEVDEIDKQKTFVQSNCLWILRYIHTYKLTGYIWSSSIVEYVHLKWYPQTPCV